MLHVDCSLELFFQLKRAGSTAQESCFRQFFQTFIDGLKNCLRVAASAVTNRGCPLWNRPRDPHTYVNNTTRQTGVFATVAGHGSERSGMRSQSLGGVGKTEYDFRVLTIS